MKIPCLAAFHTMPENITSTLYLEKWGMLSRFIYRHFYTSFYQRFDYIHCPSEMIADKLRENNYEAQLPVISNGAAAGFIKSDAPKPEDGIIRILMIGRYSREKRQDLIIKAIGISKYSDRIQLILAGKGPREKRLDELSRSLPIKPIMKFFTQSELIELINACDLYVHASDAEIEGMSCLEAMACGLTPVISNSPLCATSQFALHEKSLFAAGDARDLKDKIEFWIDNPDIKAEMSERYIEQQEVNRVDICAAKMERLYEDVIANSKRKEERLGKIRRMLIPNSHKVNKILVSKKRWPAFWVQALAGAVGFLFAPVNRLLLGLKIEGRAVLSMFPGGAVTVCNHIHPIDATAIRGAAPLRKMWITSLPDNFNTPGVGFLIKALGAVSLGRDMYELKRVNIELMRHMEMGEYVHYYPEGMLIPYHKGLRAFYDGAFAMAVQSGRPVIPMVLRERKRRGLYRLKRKPCLTLKVLKPIFPNTALSKKDARYAIMRRAGCAMAAALAYWAPASPGAERAGAR
jgi:1-acyl-sn-glycerol-3-phosphate acyltransferase